jgi:hypothetical protein
LGPWRVFYDRSARGRNPDLKVAVERYLALEKAKKEPSKTKKRTNNH